MSKITIIIDERVDQNTIDNTITDTGFFYVDVRSNYLEAPVQTIDVNALGVTYLTALKDVIDFSSFPTEEDALIWVIEKTGKTFDLSNSYVRTGMETTSPFTGVGTGTALKVRFDIPGFLGNNFREIDLYYNNAFNPTDLTLLAEIGITITGDGENFTITNDTECKISFSKPTAATDEYVIQFEAADEIIAV